MESEAATSTSGHVGEELGALHGVALDLLCELRRLSEKEAERQAGA